MTSQKQLERDLALFEKLDDRALNDRIVYGIYKLAPVNPERAADYTLQYDIICKQHSEKVKRQGLR